ncbi:DUF3618 domain-containing protein [Mycobacteroides saopaulense]|uniref:DUF3618 domain-containing protein n=1 Tax=Mycobacteroides saopaulense TaxID=1578165 RepID=A0ABX3BZ31_9MYCO|nr:DUF3618 domain-containing protein [Mycobacteroides saopaulense]OHT87139.1 hypothetical protein BKG68_12860 [Mycobacteroides saopaulense]OHU08998.1 hypothetical protein BKG73_17555 [Mycobacteroides saopaulense]
MARDPEAIKADIDKARDQLAATVDTLSDRANPQRLAEDAKASVLATLNKPAVKFTILGFGAVVAVLVVRKVAGKFHRD